MYSSDCLTFIRGEGGEVEAGIELHRLETAKVRPDQLEVAQLLWREERSLAQTSTNCNGRLKRQATEVVAKERNISPTEVLECDTSVLEKTKAWLQFSGFVV